MKLKLNKLFYLTLAFFCFTIQLKAQNDIISGQQGIQEYGDLPELAREFYFGHGGKDQLYDLCTDAEGNTYVAGVILDSVTILEETIVGKGGRNLFCAKFSSTGELLWHHITDSDQGSNSYGLNIRLDQYNNVYVLGEVDDLGVIFQSESLSTYDQQIVLICMNNEGDFKWSKQYEVSGKVNEMDLEIDQDSTIYILYDNDSTFLKSISLNGDENWEITKNELIFKDMDLGKNHIYVTGKSTSFGGVQMGGDLVGTSYYQNTFISKIDRLGNVIWVKQGITDNDFGKDNYPDQILLDEEENCYTLGRFKNQKFRFGSYELYSEDLNKNKQYIVSLDSKGNMRWVREILIHQENGWDSNRIHITDSNHLEFHIYTADTVHLGVVWQDTILPSENSVILKFDQYNGRFSSSSEDEQHKLVKPKYQENALLMDTKNFRIKIKNQIIESQSNYYSCHFEKMLVDDSNNIYIIGHYLNGLNNTSAEYPIPENVSGGFLLKLDQTGEYLWSKYISYSTSVYYPRIMELAPDGSVVFAGRFYDSTATFDEQVIDSGFGEDFTCLMKISPEGDLVWHRELSGAQIYDLSVDSKGEIYVSFIGGEFSELKLKRMLEPKLLGSGSMNYTVKFLGDGGYQWTRDLKGVLMNGAVTYTIRSVNLSDNSIVLFMKLGTWQEGEPGRKLIMDDYELDYSGFRGSTIICRLDNSGDIMWMKVFGDHKEDNTWNVFTSYDFFSTPIADSEDNIYLGINNFEGADITFESGIISAIPSFKYNWFIFKMSKDGEHIWHREHGREIQLSGTPSSNLALDLDENVYWGTHLTDTYSFDQYLYENTTDTIDVALLAYTPNGELHALKKYSTSNRGSRISSIGFNSMGSMWLLGNLYNHMSIEGEKRYSLKKRGFLLGYDPCGLENAPKIEELKKGELTLDNEGQANWLLNRNLVAPNLSLYKPNESGAIVAVHTNRICRDWIDYDYALTLEEYDPIKLNVFPIPAKDILTVQLPEFLESFTIKLFDVQGRLVQSRLLTGSSAQIDVQELTNGVYTLKVQSDNFDGQRKIILKK